MAIANQTKSDTLEALKVIDQAKEQALKVVANAAAEALKVTNVKGADDHDMLVRIDEQLKGVKADILDLKNGTSFKIEEHEKRLFRLEQAKGTTNLLVSIGIGVLLVLTSLLLYHLFQQPIPAIKL